MKRKIFSKLLMGALLVASVSSFTSCKDYDDDINSLKESVAKAALQSNLDALSSQVATVKSTADQALTTANAAATKSELSAAKTEALAKAAEGITNAATAQEAADAAKKLAQEAKDAVAAIDLSPYAKTTEVDGKIAEAAANAQTAIQAALENYVLASALEDRLAALKQEVLDANEAQMDEMKKKVDNAVEGVKTIWSAVTSVSLYATIGGNSYDPIYKDFKTTIKYDRVDQTANHYTTQKWAAATATAWTWESSFGKNDYYGHGINGGSAYTAAADKNVSFTDKDFVRPEASIIVRVSPANADITNAVFKFIDTKGENLNDLLEVSKVSAYKESTAKTRAGSVTGLWRIYFRLKDQVVASKFKSTTSNSDFTAKKIYALGINNSADQDENRFIISEYDLTFNDPALYAGPYNLEEAVIGINTSYLNGENTSKGSYFLKNVKGRQDAGTNAKYNDYIWKNESTDNEMVLGSDNTNGGTVRSAKDAYAVNNGQTFYVRARQAGKDAVQYVYVIRDDKNANVENDASEFNAWNTYTYTGLNTLIEGNTATLSVKIPESATSQLGDEVAFRLFAVNFDGTLADPDGYPFTVFVGNEKRTASLTATFHATKEYELVKVYDFNGSAVVSGQAPATMNNVAFKNGNDTYNKAKIEWLKADGSVATAWADVKKVKITFGAADVVSTTMYKETDLTGTPIYSNSMTQWPDGKAATATIALRSGTPATTDFTISLNLTKELPTADDVKDLWSWKTGQKKNGVWTAIMNPQTANDQACGDGVTPATWQSAQHFAYKGINNAINDMLSNDATEYLIKNANVQAKYQVDGDFLYTFDNARYSTNGENWAAYDRTLYVGSTPTTPVKDTYTYTPFGSDATVTTSFADGYVINLTEHTTRGITGMVYLKDIIDNSTQHASSINFNFGYVSSAKYRDIVANDHKVYEGYIVNLDNFQTVFACPFDELTVKVHPYTKGKKLNADGTAVINAGDQTWNFAYYDNEAFAPGKIYSANSDLSGNKMVNFANSLVPKYIEVTSKYGAEFVTGSLNAFTSHLVDPAVKVITAAKLPEYKEEYFTATLNATTGEITLNRIHGTQDPQLDIDSYIVVYGKCAFGHDHELRIPFTVKTKAQH